MFAAHAIRDLKEGENEIFILVSKCISRSAVREYPIESDDIISRNAVTRWPVESFSMKSRSLRRIDALIALPFSSVLLQLRIHAEP